MNANINWITVTIISIDFPYVVAYVAYTKIQYDYF